MVRQSEKKQKSKMIAKTTGQTTSSEERLLNIFLAEFRKGTACTQFLLWSGLIIKLPLQMKSENPIHISFNSNPLSSRGWLIFFK